MFLGCREGPVHEADTLTALCHLILVILMMEAIRFSETSVLTTTTWHNTPEYGIIQIISL
jgi:hypothetical protein